MTVNVPEFKTAFPEFAQNADGQVSFWLTQAVATLNASALGNQFDLATMLFAAHYLAGSMINQRAAQGGGIPGSSVGPVVSKSVGPVSKTMGTFGFDDRAGQYNNTTYGRQLFSMLKASAAGGYYRPAYPQKVAVRPPNGYLGYGGTWPYPGRRW